MRVEKWHGCGEKIDELNLMELTRIEDHIGRTLTPASLSTTGATIGCDRNGPMMGIDLRNCTNVAKNSPKRAKMPNVSMTNPKKECLVKIRMIPIAKQMVPRIFWGLLKKYSVFCVPMIKKIPTRKEILAIASNPASKRDTTPNRNKSVPAEVKNTPNFCVCVSHIIFGVSNVQIFPGVAQVRSDDFHNTRSFSSNPTTTTTPKS